MTRRLGLAGRLTLILLVVTAIGMAAMAFYVTRALETSWVEHLKAGLLTEARLIDDAVFALLRRGAPSERVQELVDRYRSKLAARITIIAVDGTVLGDSERTPTGVREMENHATRPEVRAALAGGVGNDVRRSRTLGVGMLYIAIPILDGPRVAGVLRLALPLTEVASAASSIRWTVAVGVGLAFAIVLGVGLFVSRRVTRPVAEMRKIAHRLAQGEFDRPVAVTGTDEIADLGRTLNRMAGSLRDKIESLEAERAKVSAILDSMVEGVIALDGRGRILLLNPGARAIFGLGGRSVEGRSLLEVVRQKELADLVEACQACREGERCRREVELGPPINRVLDANAVAAAFPPHGRGAFLVLHDITELRRLERVRAEFVANVSHELRTPLTAIKGYLETLLDGALEDRAHGRRFVEIVNAHAARLGRLVNDLLQLSDIESGKPSLSLVTVALREVAASVVGIVARQVAQKDLALTNHVPPDMHVRVDRDRLLQILVNLLDNAVKYTPDGGQITLDARVASAGVAEIRVADTGIGIPSTDLPRVTERFYRVDKARSRELGGTGLGLAIVKHLVKSHGGELRIESELGKGTSVFFTVPAA